MAAEKVSAEDRYRLAFAEIMAILQKVPHEEEHPGDGDAAAGEPTFGCRIMTLPTRLQEKAAKVAARDNPVNAPLSQTAIPGLEDPARLTLLTSKYWGPQPKQLTVSFLESTPADLRARIVSHMNAWNSAAGISFVETSHVGQVRISRGAGGYYSYLGTDIMLIPQNRQTMNLQDFTMNTPEREFHRVVRHETGHTLGFPHEHMRNALVALIDPSKAYEYFARTQGWSTEMVDQQVLTPLDARSIMGTEPDQDSIMCYQLPGEITYNGMPIRGGTDINATDYAFAATIYPKVQAAPVAGATGGGVSVGALTENDWEPSEDVEFPPGQ